MVRRARFIPVGLAVLSLVGAACSSSTKTTGAATTPPATSSPTVAAGGPTVDVVDFEFKPKDLTVKAGQTVTWTFTGSQPHTVTASDKAYDSGTLNKGATYTHTYTAAGTYKYYCSIHGTASGTGMAGTVTVTA